MKKIIILAILLSSTSLTFASTNESAIALNFKNVAATKIDDFEIRIDKNSTTEEINSQIESAKMSGANGFILTFCDDEGCESGYIDLNEHSWEDVLDVIYWWLGWK